MRIIQIVPPWIKPWPPQSYGAIERVVWELQEAMKRHGADVRHATEDDETRALTADPAGYDFVHVHTPPQGALLRGLGVPYIATSHWSQHWNDTPEGAEARQFVDGAVGHLALCDRLIHGRRCAVIGQGVNLEEHPKRESVPEEIVNGGRWLMVGSYQYAHTATVNPVERKRFRHGIKVLKMMPEATLTIAGPGEPQMIWDICAAEGVDRARVQLPGNLNREQLVALMHESTVLLHAATQEVVALVPLEAMACGLPVICAGPSNEYGAGVVEYDHWEHLPDLLTDIVEDYESCVDWGYQHAEACTWDIIAGRALATLSEWQTELKEVA